MNINSVPVITLDGLSGAGKGTISLRLAANLGFHYLDSGIFYRLLALEAERTKASLESEESMANLASQLDPVCKVTHDSQGAPQLSVFWKDQEVTRELRTETCGVKASKIAGYRLVRKALLEPQRAFQKAPGLVADGRDMGEVIFPKAIVKFFLSASIDARAERRQLELKQKGNYASLTEIRNAIVQRDTTDQPRLAATLQAIPKACIIDTTCLSIVQVMAIIEQQLSAMSLYFH